MFRSTLNHTQALISTSINAVCARTNSSEKYRVTELGYCGTTLLTSGNSVSMMILFTSVVDGRFFPRVGSGLIVMTSASLEIVNVDIVLDSPLSSFVLLSASSSGVLLKDGLITQKHKRTVPNSNTDICSWSTGIIQTTDCELNITDNKFTRIS
ncbi:hypothetical protein BLNAU_1103 [Blattamonas nauphoetae]|uniref:Uncharacterized protein n=1 Tax=Blattamonas nauphoetae TaxID=2049346 RepID=A0ABQ9YJT2_9EUKA|nr:hypothetical protein BLNAU_1103 [Blattamonas nauphoetae]